MAEVTLKLPRRHEAQQKVINEQKRFNVMACGRRFGKTTLGLDILISQPKGALDGYPVAWFAPTGKFYREAWLQAKWILRDLATSINTQDGSIELITGGKIDFWTLHNTSNPGRGRKYSIAVIDEAAAATNLEHQWLRAIRPTLTDYSGGAWFLSTPMGRTYFKTLFERAQTDEDWMAWQMPTTSNPHINAAEVEIAKAELPRLVFEQEYEAKFVTEFGAVFKEPMRYDTLPTEGFQEATGCDFAYTSKAGDWTVFITGRRYGDKLYLTDAYRVQSDANVWMQRLAQVPRPFAFIGGQEKGILDLLRQQGININSKPATTDKLARAQPVAAAWNRGDVLLPTNAPWLDDVLGEILAFTGNDRVDDHDDVIDALASVHHALFMSREPRITVI